MKRLKKSFTLLIATISTSLLFSCGSNDSTQLPDLSAPAAIQSAAPSVEIQSADKVVTNGAPYTGRTFNAVFHGTVTEILPDDTSGLKHEKFMFKLTDGLDGKYNGTVVLVAHDIDRAPYVPIKVGDTLEIKGDFLADTTPDKVLHWTHHDEKHKHPDGYIKLNGKIYT